MPFSVQAVVVAIGFWGVVGYVLMGVWALWWLSVAGAGISDKTTGTGTRAGFMTMLALLGLLPWIVWGWRQSPAAAERAPAPRRAAPARPEPVAAPYVEPVLTPEQIAQQRLARRDSAVTAWARALNPELVGVVGEMDAELVQVQGSLARVQQMKAENPDYPQVFERDEARLSGSVERLATTRDAIRRELTDAYLRRELESALGGEVSAVETAALLERATQALGASRTMRREVERQTDAAD